jgi:hypothetical protein
MGWIPDSGYPIIQNSVAGGAVEFIGDLIDTHPSYIGINCGTDTLLTINLETHEHGNIKGFYQAIDYQSQTDQIDYNVGGSESGHPPPPYSEVIHTRTYGDYSNSRLNATECFRTLLNADDPAGGITVEPDKWHHLLLSIDLTNDCITHGTFGIGAPPITVGQGTDNAPKMWLAYDDVNKTNKDLSYYWPDGYFDPNAILTLNAYQIAGWHNEPPSDFQDAAGTWHFFTVTGVNAPAFSYAPLISSNAETFGIPASVVFVDNIYPVELAELQFFTGVMLDTSVEANRRAFIDADGKPVDPNKKASDDDPLSGSIELIGQQPSILLHGSNNWIAGKNTGPMIDNPDYDPTKPESADNPKLIPDPNLQFTPTGKIVSYTPDPSLDRPPEPPPMRLQRRIRVPA